MCLTGGAARKTGKSCVHSSEFRKRELEKKVQTDSKLTMSAKCWECQTLSQISHIQNYEPSSMIHM